MEDPTTLAKAEQNLLRKWLISKILIIENRKKVTCQNYLTAILIIKALYSNIICTTN